VDRQAAETAVSDLISTDIQAELLERRIASLEEIIAAPWLRRRAILKRLRRSLRISVMCYEGDFFDRRAEYETARYLAWQKERREA
jgi:hypothetical protein